MTIDVMVTVPRFEQNFFGRVNNKQRVKALIDRYDCHKWAIGFEVGKGGYQHLQCRIRFSGDNSNKAEKERVFNQVKGYLPTAHVEYCSDDWSYECKSGRFITSDEEFPGSKVRSCRFGTMNRLQKQAVRALRGQNDREVMVWYDPRGNIGKSWLVRHLVETRQACYVPPTIDTIKGIMQFTCSAWDGQGIIIIDIPRSFKWSEQLYVGLESIKDGFLYDTRYSAKMKDVWGVKLLVLCNVKPKLDKLSADRWAIYEATRFLDDDGRTVTHTELEKCECP